MIRMFKMVMVALLFLISRYDTQTYLDFEKDYVEFLKTLEFQGRTK